MNSCDCGTTCSLPFDIFTGEDKTLNLRVAYQATGLPFDLTDCSEIDIALPNADGTFAHLLLSTDQVIINDPTVLGSFSAAISHTVSALLNVGVLQDFTVSFTISSKVTIVKYAQSLNVLEAP